LSLEAVVKYISFIHSFVYQKVQKEKAERVIIQGV
jgi:hypothetical protein